MEIGCVLLCSGYGRRFGSNKLLALLDGVPLYRRAFAALPPTLFTKAVVTSQYGEILAQAGKLGYLPLLNCHPWEGVAAGIRLGPRRPAEYGRSPVFGLRSAKFDNKKY